jgi:hypothetical protein
MPATLAAMSARLRPKRIVEFEKYEDGKGRRKESARSSPSYGSPH